MFPGRTSTVFRTHSALWLILTRLCLLLAVRSCDMFAVCAENSIGAEGARALSDALQSNRTLTFVDLGGIYEQISCILHSERSSWNVASSRIRELRLILSWVVHSVI